MEFNRFESFRTLPVFAPTDSHYQFPLSIPMKSPPEHHGFDGVYFGSHCASYHERQGSQGKGIANTEESDMASRSRLTQEQLAHLEREFQQRFKPNTEYKRGLAESMGVEYQKVNTSHEPRFDLSTDEEAGEFPIRNLPHHPERVHQPHPSAHFSSPEHGPLLAGDFLANLDFHSLNHAPPQYNIHPDALTDSIDNITANSNYGSNEALQPNFSNVVGTEPTWPAHDLYGLSIPKMSAPSIMEQDPFGWSPVSSTDYPGQLHGSKSTQSNAKSHSSPMYQNTINGDPVGNPSSQTFVTASSEDGEHTKLITPPQQTSPMPEPNQGIFPRRDSNSSELAEDFDTIHLQQRQLGLGLYTTNPNPISAPDHASGNGLATPDISPTQPQSNHPRQMAMIWLREESVHDHQRFSQNRVEAFLTGR
ncbi:hypothetical protein ABVK25_003606 [Lepraria finkii]|uniref:Homeobox domain-containing protein n=1 Tax=Lepraria finkii TaxID=1340010 RepID=A0ABR4BDP2_9LECA